MKLNKLPYFSYQSQNKKTLISFQKLIKEAKKPEKQTTNYVTTWPEKSYFLAPISPLLSRWNGSCYPIQLHRIWTDSVQLKWQIKSLPSCNHLTCIDNETSSVTCENVYDYSLKKVFYVIQGCFMKMEYVQIFIKSHKTNLSLSPVQSNFNKAVFSTSIAFLKTLVIRLRN